MQMPADKPFVTLAITGASGAIYGWRLLECLLRYNRSVYLVISPPARIVLKLELGLELADQVNTLQSDLCQRFNADKEQLRVFAMNQWTAPIASGSAAPQSMVICPCTTGTLSAVAIGASDSLLERAADVILKERRRLVMVIRETPLSSIHLENMLKLSRLGVIILPACPGFYHQPQQLSDLVDFVVARTLDALQIENDLIPRWYEELAYGNRKQQI